MAVIREGYRFNYNYYGTGQTGFKVVAEGRTVGKPFACVTYAKIKGVQFSTNVTGSHTIRCTLWHIDGSKIATKDQVCTGPGDYTVYFDSIYYITDQDLVDQQADPNIAFMVSMWETTDSYFSTTESGGSPTIASHHTLGYSFFNVSGGVFTDGAFSGANLGVETKPTAGAGFYKAPISPIIDPIEDVAFSSGSVQVYYYSVGSSGTVLKYNGISWSEMSHQPTETLLLTACDALAFNFMFAGDSGGTSIGGGGSGGNIYRWDDISWTTEFTYPTNFEVSDIFILSTSSIYATAYNNFSNVGKLSVSSGNSQWTELKEFSGKAKAVWGTASNSLYVLVIGGTDAGLQYWNGSVWAKLPGAAITDAHNHSIYGVSNTDLWISASSGDDLYHWNGTIISSEYSGFSGSGSSGSWYRGTDSVHFSGFDKIVGYNGAVFVDEETVSATLYAIDGVDRYEIAAVGVSNFGGMRIWRYSQFGWSEDTYPASSIILYDIAGFTTDYLVIEYPPTLIDEPVTSLDVRDLTSTVLDWESASPISTPANIKSLTIRGVTAILNNIVQAGFTGSAVPTAAIDQYGLNVTTEVSDWNFPVRISGDYAVMGFIGSLTPPVGTEAAIFYRRTTGNTWVLDQQINAPIAQASFGYSIAIEGETALVGAPYESDIGAVYIYSRSGGSWAYVDKLTPSDGAIGDEFGLVVEINGNSIVVGAPSVGANRGAAYIFVNSGGWSEQQKIVISDPEDGDLFGSGVAIDDTNNFCLVGAPSKSSMSAPYNIGAAYLFTRSGTTWSENYKFVPSDGTAYNYFGYGVAVRGTDCLISSYQADSSGFDRAGAVYYYHKAGAVWTEEQIIYPSDSYIYQNFGWDLDVDFDNGRMIVGTTPRVGAITPMAGECYIYQKLGLEWVQAFKLEKPTGSPSGHEYYGAHASISGDYAVASVEEQTGNPFEEKPWLFFSTGFTDPSGYRAEITPIVNHWPGDTSLGWEIVLDNGWERTFTGGILLLGSDITVDGIFVVAKDLLKINFTGNIVTINSLNNVDNFSISDGSNELTITEVLPTREQVGSTTSYVLLVVKGAQWGTLYTLSVLSGKLYDTRGASIVPEDNDFYWNRTKIDSVLGSFPECYSKKIGGTIRSVIEAIMISDEEIGGDY